MQQSAIIVTDWERISLFAEAFIHQDHRSFFATQIRFREGERLQAILFPQSGRR